VWFSVRDMADSSAAHSSPSSRSRVVRSLARAAERPCSRPGCPAPARATLSFSYATAEAFLDRLADESDPQRYDLCSRHASRTEPPRGWGLTDRRPDDDRLDHEPPPVVRDLGGDATVAVLAAALRAVPDAPTAVPRAPVDDLAPARAERTLSAPPIDPPDRDDLPPRRRDVVDTLLGVTPAVPASRDGRHDPAVEPPVVRTPRPVPAAGDRGPATDW
jgi:hypothetical protein